MAHLPRDSAFFAASASFTSDTRFRSSRSSAPRRPPDSASRSHSLPARGMHAVVHIARACAKAGGLDGPTAKAEEQAADNTAAPTARSRRCMSPRRCCCRRTGVGESARALKVGGRSARNFLESIRFVPSQGR